MSPSQRSILLVLDTVVGKSAAEIGGKFMDHLVAKQDLWSLAQQGFVVLSSRCSGWVLTEKGANHRITRMGGDHSSDVPGYS